MCRVLILYTGGTIGMVAKPSGSPAGTLTPHPLSLDDIARFLPALQADTLALDNGQRITLRLVSLCLKDSSDITPSDWVAMANAIADEDRDYDGVVILHGTDTMAYTAYALHFLLAGLNKPVVLTGAQLPMYAPNSDAVANIVDAVRVAGYKASGFPYMPRVMVAFGRRLMVGIDTIKASHQAFAAFDTPNMPYIATFGTQDAMDCLSLPVTSINAVRVHGGFSNRVARIRLFPGLCTAQLTDLLAHPDIDGYVVEGYGAGNAPTDSAFMKAFDAAKNKLIVLTSQCAHGGAPRTDYAASAAFADAVPTRLSADAALVKLMWVLGTFDKTEWRAMMEKPINGE